VAIQLNRLPQLALAITLITACHGQERWDDVNFRSASIGGIHLYGVSVYTSYLSNATPASLLLTQPVASANRLQSDAGYGVQWTLGWQRQRDNSTLSVRYLGSYGGQFKYTDLNAFGHSVNITANRKVGTKWNVGLTASADYRTFAQFLFQPTSLSLLAQTPADFNDLAAAFSLGQFSSSQAASILTGTPLLGSPERSLLTSDRVLSYYGTVMATYQHSSRLSFTFAGIGAGGQNTLGDTQTYVVPRTLGANAGLSLAYSLSPRTEVGLGVNETRTANQFQSSYSTNATGSFGRKMGLHWFIRANGGMAYTTMLQQAFGPTPRSQQVIGGGSLGYRAFAHTLIASYNRAASDTYGIATGVVTGTTVAWSWRRPGSSWLFFATGGRQEIRNAGYTSLSGWQATGGLSRRLSSALSWRTEYTYFASTGNYLGIATNQAIHSVRVSLAWGPEMIPTTR
jgi:hypothetical protein